MCCQKDMVPWGCVNDCNAKTCANLKKKSNQKKCSTECYSDKCHCKKGLYLNDCNVCVHKDHCDKSCKEPPIKCPGQNEELIPCFDPSNARFCKHARDEPGCTPNAPYDVDLYDTDDGNAWWPDGKCILNVCDCKRDYYRNKCGICVKLHKCDKECKAKSHDECSDPNEKRYETWRECDARTCINLHYPMSRDKEYQVHHNKCDCKSGYYRDDCGKCVEKSECNEQRPCKCTNPCKHRNQALRCVNSCTQRTCAKALDVPRICKTKCYDDCDCKEWFWLNKHGQCVSREECTEADIEYTAKFLQSEDVKSDTPEIIINITETPEYR